MEKPEEVEVTIKCTTCDGDGEIENDGPKACPSCGGNGYIYHKCENPCEGFPNSDCRCSHILNSQDGEA